MSHDVHADCPVQRVVSDRRNTARQVIGRYLIHGRGRREKPAARPCEAARCSPCRDVTNKLRPPSPDQARLISRAISPRHIKSTLCSSSACSKEKSLSSSIGIRGEWQACDQGYHRGCLVLQTSRVTWSLPFSSRGLARIPRSPASGASRPPFREESSLTSDRTAPRYLPGQ